MEDIITLPPEQEPYDRLKAELVCRLYTSREQHVRQLLSHEEMGDRKPSQFLRYLKALAPDVPNDFLRAICASCLPLHLQVILAGQTDGSLDSASHHADRICEVTPLPTTASVSRSTPDTTSGLLERIEELTRQVDSLRTPQHGSRPQSRGRHSSQSRDCSRSTSNYPPTPHDTCWYHWEFGDEVQKCTPPCTRQQRDSRQERLPPAEKLHQPTLTAANVYTTSSGRFFISDLIIKQRYLVKTGCDLCVFPHKSCRGAGNAQITTCTLPMGPPSPHMNRPHSA